MDISRDGSGREVPIELLCAELHANSRSSPEVDGPLESLGAEPRLLKQGDRAFDGIECNDKVDILSHHRLFRPVVDRNPADGTPRHVRPFKTVNEPHDVVRSAGSLPIVELLCSHNTKLANGDIRCHLHWPNARTQPWRPRCRLDAYLSYSRR